MRISDLYFYLKCTLLGICIMQSSLFYCLNAYLKSLLNLISYWIIISSYIKLFNARNYSTFSKEMMFPL